VDVTITAGLSASGAGWSRLKGAGRGGAWVPLTLLYLFAIERSGSIAPSASKRLLARPIEVKGIFRPGCAESERAEKPGVGGIVLRLSVGYGYGDASSPTREVQPGLCAVPVAQVLRIPCDG